MIKYKHLEDLKELMILVIDDESRITKNERDALLRMAWYARQLREALKQCGCNGITLFEDK
jgi:hypothetical protein